MSAFGPSMRTGAYGLFIGFFLLPRAFANADSNQLVDSSKDEGKVVQSLKIEAPTMTEEDQYGYTMPDRYRCDSCRAVVYHLNEALTKKQPKSRRLQEWEYVELFEETCKGAFKGYGIKLAGGKNVLSGPALTSTEKLQPGMGAIQMGGESWEKRLGEICRKFVSDTVGEEELYEHFRTEGSLTQKLCFETTRDCQTDQPSVRQSVSNSERKQKKKNTKKEKTVDLNDFMKKLASQHGIPTDSYTKKRSQAEWQRTIVQMAAQITKAADGEATVEV